jgi:hypothetical protein
MSPKNLPKKQWEAPEDADNDDRQIGHILSRREVLRLLGVAGVTLLVGCEPAQSGSPTATSATPAEAAAAPTPTEASAAAGAGG